MKAPKVIFLDAVGTLFGVRGSVGEIYNEIAAPVGVNIEPKALNRAFKQAFSSSPPLAFPEAKSEQIAALERQWWREVVSKTYTLALARDRFEDFDEFFNRLYDRFATATPWYLYPDTIPFLRKWQKQAVELGIISNFDSRIYRVIAELGLKDFFSSITISSNVGAAKPNSQIFIAALQKYDLKPEKAWYIGDNLKEDYYGAKAVGIRSFLLQRSI
ncbi:MAG: HAD-IA family hydrolase [Prochloraceae cyanobacterium]|nr:HAD-IA family hydrolase [Prochloraceae cyanobacterium]